MIINISFDMAASYAYVILMLRYYMLIIIYADYFIFAAYASLSHDTSAYMLISPAY